MKILIVYYSRSGHTARLAEALARELEARGALVKLEKIHVTHEWSKWILPIPLLPLLPFLPLYLVSAKFRRLWHHIYFQPSQSIQPLAYPDVSQFDQILLGTPKWLYIAYPVAKWLDKIAGIKGKPVYPFATFCGPPLKVFELEMLFAPLTNRLSALQATVPATLSISSNYHPYFVFGEMEYLFRWLSKRIFRRELQDFTLDGPVGQEEFRHFLEEVLKPKG